MKMKVLNMLFSVVLCFSGLSLKAQAPDWSVNPGAFSNSMNMIGFLWFDKAESTDGSDLVAAFINGEVRGIVSPSYVPEIDRFVVFLTIYSNEANGDITFQAYDSSTDEVKSIATQATFIPNGLIGGLESSFVWSDVVLNSDAEISSYSLPSQFGSAIFDSDTIRLDVSLDVGEELSSQIASFVTSPDASITIANIDQLSDQTENDFTGVVSYRVQSEDLLTIEFFYVKATLVNQSPTDMVISNAKINENLSASIFIGSFSTTDPNLEDLHEYTFASGDGSVDNNRFEISENSLITKESYNFETNDQFSIRIRSMDTFQEYVEKIILIEVGDVNDSPSDLSLEKTDIDENLGSTISLSTINTTDEDQGAVFEYELVAGAGGEDNDKFLISENELLTNTSFNFEVQGQLKIRLKVIDNGGATYEEAFIINVNDTNDAPVLGESILDILIAAKDALSVSILEGTFVDEDEDVLSFSATMADGSILAPWIVFNESTKTFVIAPGLNNVGTFSVKVRATDPDGAFAEDEFSIVVDIVSSTDELPDLSDQISVFPNPAVHLIRINASAFGGKSARLEMLEVSTGKIVRSLDVSTDQQIELNVKTYAQGLYVLNLMGSNKVARKKVLIKR